MKITLGVMGSSAFYKAEVERSAFEIGRRVAEKGAVLITGATTGLPLHAAMGAKEAGGQVIGFSPAINMEEHRRIGLPEEFHDLIFCTGFSSHGRNLINIRASNGLIFLGGSMGALNEFTIAYDSEKIIGILEGSGGFCNSIQSWMQQLAKPGNRSIIHYTSEEASLVEMVYQSILNKR